MLRCTLLVAALSSQAASQQIPEALHEDPRSEYRGRAQRPQVLTSGSNSQAGDAPGSDSGSRPLGFNSHAASGLGSYAGHARKLQSLTSGSNPDSGSHSHDASGSNSVSSSTSAKLTGVRVAGSGEGAYNGIAMMVAAGMHCLIAAVVVVSGLLTVKRRPVYLPEWCLADEEDPEEDDLPKA